MKDGGDGEAWNFKLKEIALGLDTGVLSSVLSTNLSGVMALLSAQTTTSC